MKLIFKKNLSTISHQIDVKASDSGKELRQFVADIEKVSPEEVVLKFWGDVVPDDVLVSEYKMKEEDVVTYVVNLKKVKGDESAGDGAMEVQKLITLTLKKEDQTQLQVDVTPQDSIAVVRVKIDDKHDIPSGAIRLKYNNMMMFPAKRLIDYYIDQDVTLDMIVDKKIEETERAKSKEERVQAAGGVGGAPANNQKSQNKELKLKVKFHDGDEKDVTVDIDQTMEDLRKKLLNLKPIDKEKETSYKLKVMIGGEDKEDKTKIRDLGLKDSSVVATMLEKLKGEDDLKFTIKRSVGTESDTVIIDKNIKVNDFKKSLEDKFKATASEIILKLGMSELKDEQTLVEAGVQDDSVVTLSVFKKGLFGSN